MDGPRFAFQTAFLLAALGAAGCRREHAAPPPAPVPAPVLAVKLLPDEAPPLVALGDTIEKDGFFRRAYGRPNGEATLEVTLAAMPSDADGYRRWVKGSADYAQVVLPFAPEDANGFFTCAPQGGACDLHIQLRAGVHVEIMGQGRATRAELEAFIPFLPWVEIERRLGAGRPI